MAIHMCLTKETWEMTNKILTDVMKFDNFELQVGVGNDHATTHFGCETTEALLLVGAIRNGVREAYCFGGIL